MAIIKKNMEEELAKKQAKVDKYRKGNKKNEDNGEHPKKNSFTFWKK